MSQPQHLRGDYRHFQPITTRWHDNDIYGHVNNVVYYGYFDSAVNTYLIEQGGRIAFKSAPGPYGFSPAGLEEAIQKLRR